MKQPQIPRGLRNCNPGNIRISRLRYKGEIRPSKDKSFKQFESMAYGYRAMISILRAYNYRHGMTNIRAMITRWAPPSENNTKNYIAKVSELSGVQPDDAVNTHSREMMAKIVAAMSFVENGRPANYEDCLKGYDLL